MEMFNQVVSIIVVASFAVTNMAYGMPMQGKNDALRAVSLGAASNSRPIHELVSDLTTFGEAGPGDLNVDMFRDYDYRTRGEEISPSMAFRMALVWAQMALANAEKFDIKSRKVLVARDCRDTNPRIKDALIAGLTYAGLDVVYIADEIPNCASSYSWAAMQHRPLMGIFMTASHITDENVSGFKVSIQDESGELQSLTTREIKEASLNMAKDLMAHPEKIAALEAPKGKKGKVTTDNIDTGLIRYLTLIGRIAELPDEIRNISIFTLTTLFKLKTTETDLLSILDETEAKSYTRQPLKGRRVVIEAAHTPSGYLAEQVFKNLGAEVILLHGEIKALKGKHRADPSKKENLTDLKATMTQTNADFGLAFDLDGDRGAIILPVNGNLEDLSPDNITASMLPFLAGPCGYKYKKLAVVRDVLSTRGVDETAQQLDIEPYTTDAGYPFLKAKVRALKQKGYVVPMYGERSGHAWLDITGAFENPIAVAVLFAIMNYAKGYEQYRYKPVAYKQSTRFQPLFHPSLLAMLSKDKRNDTGWTFGSTETFTSKELLLAISVEKKPPQKIIALGRDYCIRKLSELFSAGATFTTPAGKLVVQEFKTYQDPPGEGGLYRFADINFTLNGKYAGRFVFRASANEPTFVCSFETPVWENETADSKSVLSRYDSVGGLVLDMLERLKFAEVVTDKDYANKQDAQETLLRFRGITGTVAKSFPQIGFDANFKNEMLEAIARAQDYFESLMKNPQSVKAEFSRLQVDVNDADDIDSFRRHLAGIPTLIERIAWPLAYDLLRKVDMRIKLMPTQLKKRNETFLKFADEIRLLHNKIGTLLTKIAAAGLDLSLFIPPDIEITTIPPDGTGTKQFPMGVYELLPTGDKEKYLRDLEAFDPIVRQAAAVALGHMGAQAKDAIESLRAVTVIDEHEIVRHAAREAIWQIQSLAKSRASKSFPTAIEQLDKQNQSVWFDGALTDEQFEHYMAEGVVAQTTNLTIFDNAIKQGMFDTLITRLIKEGRTKEQIYDAVVISYIRSKAGQWLPVYGRTKKLDGYASIEINPEYAYDEKKTIAEGQRLIREIGMPNIMTKVPATKEGIEAIEEMTYLGINVNVTLLFGVENYIEVAKAYIRGLQRRAAEGKDISYIQSVASFFVSRVNCKPNCADPQIKALIEKAKQESNLTEVSILEGLLGKAAIANCWIAYSAFKGLFDTEQFRELAQLYGANLQRLLWASTGVKDNETYDDGTKYHPLTYVVNLPLPYTVNTMPKATIDELINVSDITPEPRNAMDYEAAWKVFEELASRGIGIATITDMLQKDGVNGFAKDYQNSLKQIQQKIDGLAAADKASKSFPTAIEQLDKQNQSVWFDGALTTERFPYYSAEGIVGQTTNPSIFDAALKSGMFNELIDRLIREGRTKEQIYDTALITYIRDRAKQWLPVYEKTNGLNGYVSIEINPDYAYDAERTIAEGQRLVKEIGMPNVMVKVPATKEGIEAIEELTYLGINVNITLLFGVPNYIEVAEAYIRGIARRIIELKGYNLNKEQSKNLYTKQLVERAVSLPISAASGVTEQQIREQISKIQSVASFFVSRVNCKPNCADPQIKALIEKAKQESNLTEVSILEGLLGKAAIANCWIAYSAFKGLFDTEQFRELAQLYGANLQRLLWASTGVKPEEVYADGTPYSPLTYVVNLPLEYTVDTMPQATIDELIKASDITPEPRNTMDFEEAKRIFDELAKRGIDIDNITDRLQEDGVASFAKEPVKSLKWIEDRIALIKSQQQGAKLFPAGNGVERNYINELTALLRETSAVAIQSPDDIKDVVLGYQNIISRADTTNFPRITSQLNGMAERATMQKDHLGAVSSLAEKIKGLPDATIFVDANLVPAQQRKLLGELLFANNGNPRALEKELGCEIIIKYKITAKEVEEAPNPIIISGDVKVEGAKHLLVKGPVVEGAYTPIIPLIVLAKAMAGLKDINAQQDLAQSITSFCKLLHIPMDTEKLEGYLATQLLAITLPTPRPFDAEIIENLHRQILEAAIAA